jgi:membrane-associated phospholipid phosphatase
MNISSPVTQVDFQQRLPSLPPFKNYRFARIISRLGSPPIISSISSFAAALAINTPQAWAWAIFQNICGIALPVLYVFWMLKTGRISDFDMYFREQRGSTYFVAAISSGLAMMIMMLGGANHLQIVMPLVAIFQSLGLAIINRYFKISAHASATAGFSILQCYLMGVNGLLFLSAIPLVAWSRIRLGRHTTFQTIAGSLLGVGTSLIPLALFL